MLPACRRDDHCEQNAVQARLQTVTSFADRAKRLGRIRRWEWKLWTWEPLSRAECLTGCQAIPKEYQGGVSESNKLIRSLDEVSEANGQSAQPHARTHARTGAHLRTYARTGEPRQKPPAQTKKPRDKPAAALRRGCYRATKQPHPKVEPLLRLLPNIAF